MGLLRGLIVYPLQGKYWFFCLVLIGFYFVIFIGRDWVDSFTELFVVMRSEYTAMEQLSKVCLILVLVSMFLTLRSNGNEDHLKASAAFFSLAITMYLSESNMIVSHLQPVMGVMLILPAAYWFLRAGSWLTLIAFCIGFFIAGVGSLNDFLQESALVRGLVPEAIHDLILNINEELLDTLGVGFLALSALIAGRSAVSEVAENNLTGLFIIFGSVIFLAVGNGLSHYQYAPGIFLLSIGSGLSLLGLVLFLVVDKYLMLDKFQVLRGGQVCSSLAFVVFFLILPALWGIYYSNIFSILLWACAILAGRSLYESALMRLKFESLGDSAAE